ncbi:MAG: N-6 DNA methylase [Pirellulaceae bacterium]|nr:N-6 DNA methylase [Pirellulaceae bacterium]
MAALRPELRKDLERAIIKARNLVVADVTDRLKELNVNEGKRGALSESQAQLRIRLRAHGKQIGDVRNSQSDAQQIDRLVQECAYEQWHRMIFVRFLAENEFLIDPEYGQSVSMDALAEIAEESKAGPWVLGGQFASASLPAIFRKDDPLLELRLSQETQVKLNDLLNALPAEVFTADDSLGWVYQFWQSEEKDRVNASGDKIDGRSLPAVTQLFTEHYMVLFLLHNTLGAWHAGKVLAENPELATTAMDEATLRRTVALKTAGGYEFEYLRFVKVEEASSLLRTTSDQTSDFNLCHRDVVREEKSQDGSSTFDHNWFDWNEPIDVGCGNLPHIKQEGVTYFVTFRTADSLPADKWKAWKAEREEWLEKNPKPHTDKQKKEYYAKFPAQIEKWLDQKYGALVLAESEPNKIVDDALKHFDGDRYVLDEYVVAANHVHALVTPLGENDLSDILHSWKSFSANKINTHLGKAGVFWQKESFDHAVRSPESLEKFRAYIHAHKVEKASSLLTDPPGFVSENESDEYSTGSERPKSLEGSSTWRPMGGTFSGWPKTAAGLKVLDPSCGSGHFLVAAFELLVRMRMQEEGLTVDMAVEAVLRDNLFGLEIDPRCTQIAAFNVAMAVWKLTGPKPLPPMRNIACSGIPLGNSRDEWMKSLKVAMPNSDLGFQWGQLYDMFSKADTLGSLINPQRFFGSGLLTDEQLDLISDALSKIIVDDRNATDEQQELAAAAQGLTRATELLSGRYTLVITNVPYLGRGKQNDELKKYLDTQYALGKADLATAFVLRCLEFCIQGGSTALVTPQNWLFLTTYKKLRETLLERRQWDFVARLGPGAFETITGEVVNVALLGLTSDHSAEDWVMTGMDVSVMRQSTEKSTSLRGSSTDDLVLIRQGDQLKNPDARIALSARNELPLLSNFAHGVHGLGSKDTPCFFRQFWEVPEKGTAWEFLQTTVTEGRYFGGMEQIVFWEQGKGLLCDRGTRGEAILAGGMAWRKPGVIISQMNKLLATLYVGDMFDKNAAVILPEDPKLVTAIWAFCSSHDYNKEVRKIDQKVNVTNVTLVKVPFDIKHWQKVAAEKYPNGLPEPESDDPTQWLFHGWPVEAASSRFLASRPKVEVASSRLSDKNKSQDGSSTLQVAVARLLGYRWPAELDSKMRLSQRARALVARCASLDEFVDDDGIVCIPSVRGEDPASDRLLRLLNACKVDAASSRVIDQVMSKSLEGSSTLDDWLRDRFFQEHCELFHQRPFIWHIWDGRKDGFSALVNYHKLAGPQGKKLLENLTYSYLGDWITRQEAAVKSNESGADDRLLAAKDLQEKLKAILRGEPPYDIFVRWKPLHEQLIGWTPDINDGVRMNIRPFMLAELSRGRKGAGVLRFPPKIKWTKDRGKEPKRPIEDYPWFWSNVDAASSRVDYAGKSQDGSSTFAGDRWNDLHYSNAFKQQARDAFRATPET